MLEAEVQQFAMTLEVFFRRPQPFSKDKMDALADWLTDDAEGLAIRPEQVRVRHADLVFDYELSANLFGGNATFRQDAEKTVFSARGARTRQDAEILRQVAARFVKVVAAPEPLEVAFSANAYAALGSESEREAYLAGFRPSQRVVGPGALGFVRLPEWPQDIRIAIEPSIGMAQSLFFSWNTRFLPSTDPGQSLESLATALGTAAQIYGVTFKPLM